MEFGPSTTLGSEMLSESALCCHALLESNAPLTETLLTERSKLPNTLITAGNEAVSVSGEYEITVDFWLGSGI
jgi:hypothetical protein